MAIAVNEINELYTENFVLNEVNTNINETVEVDVSDYNAIEVFPKFVNVKATVLRFTEGTIDIPISVVNKPNDIKINYFPKSVILLYYVDLDNYNEIKASDFIVECDYKDLEDGQTYFIPKVVKKPEFIKRINIKQKRIDFIKL